MIKFIDNYFTHEDNRGTINGLIQTGLWGEINIITSKSNTIRGNHYHKNTTELFIILDGEIEVTLQKVKNNQLIETQETVKVSTGDVFMIQSMINHTFKVLQDSQWINVLSKPMSGNNLDFFRIEE